MKDSSFIKIYLAGACKHMPDEGMEWRKNAINAFRKIDKYDALKSCVIDPTAFFTYSNPVHKNDKQVKNFYMSQIRDCDVVLANINNSAVSPGTSQEIQYAVDYNVPVIGFGHENTYPWIENVDCDVVFDTMEEAITYIKNYYMTSAQPIHLLTKT